MSHSHRCFLALVPAGSTLHPGAPWNAPSTHPNQQHEVAVEGSRQCPSHAPAVRAMAVRHVHPGCHSVRHVHPGCRSVWAHHSRLVGVGRRVARVSSYRNRFLGSDIRGTSGRKRVVYRPQPLTKMVIMLGRESLPVGKQPEGAGCLLPLLFFHSPPSFLETGYI